MTAVEPRSASERAGMEQSGNGPRSVSRVWILDIAFGALVLVVATARFLILRDGGAPATIDNGNWVAFGDAIFGGDVRSPTIVYPPLIPILAKASAMAFGLISGTATLGAVSSAAPAVGFYVAMRRTGLGAVILPGAILVLGAGAVGEAAAWGGFPQLIGLGLAPLIFVEVDRWCTTGRRRSVWRLGLLFMVLFATTHFVAVAVATASVAMLLMGLPRMIRQHRPWRAWATDALIIALPSAWLLPLYASLFGAFAGSAGDFRFLNQLSWSNLLGRIEFIYRDFPHLWRVALPLTVLTPLLFAGRRSSTVWRILVAVLVSVALLTAVTREGRFLYFATLAVALALTLWFETLSESRWLVGEPDTSDRLRGLVLKWALPLAALAIAAWQIVAGLQLFHDQRDFYGVLTPGLYQSLERIHIESAEDAIVAVASLRDAPLGWWVEAVTERETYYASALRWLAFEDEHRRARIGTEIFTRDFPNTETLASAREHGIDYLIIPTRWAFYDDTLLGPESELGRSALFRRDDVVVLSVAHATIP